VSLFRAFRAAFTVALAVTLFRVVLEELTQLVRKT
jgi:hypothetical protein